MTRTKKWPKRASSHIMIVIAVCGFFGIVVTSCNGKKDEPIAWNLTLHDTGQGVLLDITGATILFDGITYDGTNRGTLTIFDPDGYVDPTGIGGSVDGWSSPEKPGRAKLGASYRSAQQMCEIEFGPHTVTIRNRGQTLEINGEPFQIDPTTKPGFVVSTQDGEFRVRKQ